MTDMEHPEEVVIITRQIWRLKIVRSILALVVTALALLTVVFTMVLAIRYGDTKDREAATAAHVAQEASNKADELQATLDRQAAVVACRGKISGEWVNALDLVIKRQAQALVIVFTQPISQDALNAKRFEMDQAIAALDAADDRRTNQDKLCGA